MLAIINWDTLSSAEQKGYLSRTVNTESTRNIVLDIIQQVQNNGDAALFALTKQLDGAMLQTLQIDAQQIQRATIDKKAYAAIQHAIETITLYNQDQIPEKSSINTAAGITIDTMYRPIQKVGFYVPGGNKTPLISSLLMQAIPALVAGCPLKVFCTPPNSQGEINAHLLVAAHLCGIETIYSLGGAQAIAAMAYGTESVIKVDKIFGPGNSFVTEAKTMVASDPCGAAIDMPAGPSEVMVIADASANPFFVAADLLAQAEHGVDSQVFLVCEDRDFALQVNQALEAQIKNLSRQAIIEQSLAASAIIVCPDKEKQVSIINDYAPEHLIINRIDAETWVDKIKAAGTVFLGPWAAETMGDYITGSNHVLPTNGFAKNHSGLSTLDFLTRFTVQIIQPQAIRDLGPSAITLATIEGLDAHANAVQIRINSLET